jgi:hypothetical protein
LLSRAGADDHRSPTAFAGLLDETPVGVYFGAAGHAARVPEIERSRKGSVEYRVSAE